MPTGWEAGDLRAAFAGAVRDVYIALLRRPENSQSAPERFVLDLEPARESMGRSLAAVLRNRTPSAISAEAGHRGPTPTPRWPQLRNSGSLT